MGKLGEFFTAIANGSVDFASIGAFFRTCIDNFNANEHLLGIWTAIRAFCDSLGIALIVILFSLCIAMMLFGKKLIAVLRFVFFTVLGYVVGVLLVSPLINTIFALPELVSGLVVAIVSAVLSKYLYHAFVMIALGFSAFTFFFTDSVLSGFATEGQLTVCIIIGAVIAVLALIFHKVTAMLLTSACGSYCFTRVITVFVKNYEAPEVMGGKGWILTVCLFAVLTLISFIVQYKTRTRY